MLARAIFHSNLGFKFSRFQHKYYLNEANNMFTRFFSLLRIHREIPYNFNLLQKSRSSESKDS